MSGSKCDSGSSSGPLNAINRGERLDFALLDAEDAMEGAAGSPWILKPSLMNKGEGIAIVSGVACLRGAWHSN